MDSWYIWEGNDTEMGLENGSSVYLREPRLTSCIRGPQGSNVVRKVDKDIQKLPERNH